MYILNLSGMQFTFLYLKTFLAIVLFWSVCCCVYYVVLREERLSKRRYIVLTLLNFPGTRQEIWANVMKY